ncbi:hypothetical protein SAMN05216249_11181 [Acetitomaculum ruminis DSM 5522]|uniref:Sel1 repeat-containing protein n=1 Tax=Acetitomaculum ruminis DSM 5522 TaxID=1120918 RepID=A0A1I0YVR9_9FIRM|nr:hypothetical protein [Acetitomaculum ruminis]SFB17107.1 hypothetical protein SAMN05216249_11181 [Acetitomaculum ruminis DSM 5522]
MKIDKFALIDKAAFGNVEAAGLLAEGYLKGKYNCEKNLQKALKWGRYAAKRGDELGKYVVKEIEG